MKSSLHKILMVISIVGLILTIVPSILTFKGIIEMQEHYVMMTIGMVLWFATAPFWMKTKSLDDAE